LPFVARVVADVLVPDELAGLLAKATTRASDIPTKTRPSATATPRVRGDVGNAAGAPPPRPGRQAPVASRPPHGLPGFRVELHANGGAVKNIRPSLTTVIARDETAASSFSDVHAAPSLATFCALIWLSGSTHVAGSAGHRRPIATGVRGVVA
jgi:hypothetical protein